MARLSFKPDSSFFRKIVVGAVGARAVVADMANFGHRFLELERGSTETKLWKEVKRKRVRIPDLVCVHCGQRVECRAKTKLELAMSHSPTDAERAWDYGMIDSDWIAFPFCEAAEEAAWSAGILQHADSYWREKSWVRWQTRGTINYFSVQAFRSQIHARSRTKGVEEGSEGIIAWDATFSSREGVIDSIDKSAGRISVRRTSDGHRYTWPIAGGKKIVVTQDEEVGLFQVLASAVPPVGRSDLRCSGQLPAGHIAHLIESRERTQRFTGIKLARLLRDEQFRDEAATLAQDEEEDVYVRLEAVSYLNSVCRVAARELFAPHLACSDEQTQLEAVIALGESASEEAVEILCGIVDNASNQYFLRSAAAWSLSRTGAEAANRQLIKSFSDISTSLREEALDALVAIGGTALPLLLEGLHADDEKVSAGCAEAMRRCDELPKPAIDALIAELTSPQPCPWAIWLIGHLPRQRFASAIAAIQQRKPELHYAISLLWSFVESWIARTWEPFPTAEFPSR